MRLISLLFVVFIVPLASGCIYTRQYNPGGRGTYLWIPGGEDWPIVERLPPKWLSEQNSRPAAAQAHP